MSTLFPARFALLEWISCKVFLMLIYLYLESTSPNLVVVHTAVCHLTFLSTWQVVLIDQSDRFVFKPLLYELLSKGSTSFISSGFFKSTLYLDLNLKSKDEQYCFCHPLSLLARRFSHCHQFLELWQFCTCSPEIINIMWLLCVQSASKYVSQLVMSLKNLHGPNREIMSIDGCNLKW